MGLFDNTLKDSESLFLNEVALDPTFIPPIIQYRENKQKYMADCIRPLLMKRNGKNILITGAPGIGKTLATRFVLKELEEETDDIHIIYINCWKSNTAYKIVLDICELLDYKIKDLKDEDNSLLEFIKKNPNLNSSKLHEMFNTDVSYKTFRRQLERLEKANMISLEQKSEGIHGKVTIVKLREEKSLDSF